jgi:hypothetical protein
LIFKSIILYSFILMENNYFVSQQHKLNEQKKIIQSFIMYLSTITKAMENGEYNFKMINDICMKWSLKIEQIFPLIC